MTTSEISWSNELISNWEIRGALLNDNVPIVNEQDIFEYLCQLRLSWKAGENLVPKVYFATDSGETQVSSDVFPATSDDSLEGYYSRISHERSAKSTLLYVRNAQLRSGRVAKLVETFLAPVWILGNTWERLEVEVYIGRYDWTRIGIHRENCANIHQVIRGNKEMLLWPPQTLLPETAKPQCAVNGSATEAVAAGLLELADCTRIKAHCGQAIYMPSKHWHVGISREFSVAVNLSLYGVSDSKF